MIVADTGSRARRIARRFWKLALGIVIGVALGLAIPVVLALWNAANKPKDAFLLTGDVASSGPALANAIDQTFGVHLVGGHEVTMLDNGKVFDALVEDLGRARHSIHIVMYIWEPGIASDRVSAAVIARAKAGVACRIVIDAFGSSEFPEKLAPALTQAGCEVRMFRPLPGVAPLARNHRKLVVIDGAIGITGGFGIRDNWLGDGVTAGAWRDANIRFTGPAVHDAQQAFAENWQETGGALLGADVFSAPVAPTGGARAAFIASTGTSVVTRAERLTQLVIAAAKKRLWIVNAYVVPSPAIIDLMKRKAASGVDVRILAPGSKSDSKPALLSQKKLFPQLRKAGVRIWEYEGSMVHSKTMLADDELAVIGTINLDPLSLNKLDEAALLVEDVSLGAALARSFEADCARAVEVGQ
ncbi:MAG: cls1 [Myxococcales bacterium]|nr:cls1 [Myxococcales bacterium]